ncbi:chemotaxis protein [Paenibacillus melissococcoides]|uniref:Chemotaxis protein n=1 Tax=Paenibacillus melissococcoides TaxID=2912268 RepID=A0ABN8U969_9BACL|nr:MULTISPECIES: chemotaxis protein [Paenibacillus]MEB9894134.1 chemotaxis protein [Bacillus cereus]CAH8246981.1 chemotaxis protein [Paenibacillus melissococcoides]CAH8716387.1 chemotaxis protein [Paenibacillus melissococcoides]CAH8717371.1 chemotaxis protein [Paenibacillus melissococcoides]GIO76611.1 hypothetical protein J6TS7_02210 [Paenibacillus dendritiformis]
MIAWSILLAAVAWTALCGAGVAVLLRLGRTLAKAEECAYEAKRLIRRLSALSKKAERTVEAAEEVIGALNEWSGPLRQTGRVLSDWGRRAERWFGRKGQQADGSRGEADSRSCRPSGQWLEWAAAGWDEWQRRTFRHESPPASRRQHEPGAMPTGGEQ